MISSPLAQQASCQDVGAEDDHRASARMPVGDQLSEHQQCHAATIWLGPWLESMRLLQHLDQSVVWCESMGAVDIEEVKENWEDLADHLDLNDLERKLLADACWQGSSATEDAAEMSEQGSHLAPVDDICPEPVTCIGNCLGRFGPRETPYEIVERLGHGATATVYRCTRGGDQFAAKVIKLERLRLHPQFEKLTHMMNREVTLLLTLRHDKIVQLHDVVETEKPAQLILVMELMEGGQLSYYIVSRGRLSAADARDVFAQVVEGLQYIHSKGIIHRDLKPENILLGSVATPRSFPVIKLSDFGHSKLIRDGYTRAVTTVGTEQYWAPEVVDIEEKSYDERADLWSLGVVLYVMLMGTYPFSTGAPSNNFVFNGRREIEEVVRGLIRMKPGERMTLDQCLQCSWVLNRTTTDKLNSATLKGTCTVDGPEVRVRLPRAPQDVSSFKADLGVYSKKYKAGANLYVLDVIISFCDGTSECTLVQARDELVQILRHHFHDFKTQNAFDEFNISSGKVDEEDRAVRSAELEALEAIYASELEVVSRVEWLVRVRDGVALRVRLTPGYPRTEPPIPLIECVGDLLPADFTQAWLAQWQPGDFCVCQWVERVRDALPQASDNFPSFRWLTGTWAQRQLENLEPGETKAFPTTLNSFQRLVLHRLAEKLDWPHESHDVRGPEQEPARQLLVTRPRKGAPAAKNVNITLEDFMPPAMSREERRSGKPTPSRTISLSLSASQETSPASTTAATAAGGARVKALASPLAAGRYPGTSPCSNQHLSQNARHGSIPNGGRNGPTDGDSALHA